MVGRPTRRGAGRDRGRLASGAEIADARVFGGIHFRTAGVRGNALGREVAGYVMAHAMRPRGGDRDDDRDR